MQNKIIIWIATLIILITASPSVQAVEDEIAKASITGVYNVAISLETGQQYNARVFFEDMHNGTVAASADYNGYPLSITGTVTGNVEAGGAVCRFNFNKLGLASGQADITIVLGEGTYQLNGQVTGSYFKMGKSVPISAKVEGTRKSPIPPPVVNAKSNNLWIIVAVVAGLITLTVILAVLKKGRNNHKQ